MKIFCTLFAQLILRALSQDLPRHPLNDDGGKISLKNQKILGLASMKGPPELRNPNIANHKELTNDPVHGPPLPGNPPSPPEGVLARDMKAQEIKSPSDRRLIGDNTLLNVENAPGNTVTSVNNFHKGLNAPVAAVEKPVNSAGTKDPNVPNVSPPSKTKFPIEFSGESIRNRGTIEQNASGGRDMKDPNSSRNIDPNSTGNRQMFDLAAPGLSDIRDTNSPGFKDTSNTKESKDSDMKGPKPSENSKPNVPINTGADFHRNRGMKVPNIAEARGMDPNGSATADMQDTIMPPGVIDARYPNSPQTKEKVEIFPGVNGMRNPNAPISQPNIAAAKNLKDPKDLPTSVMQGPSSSSTHLMQNPKGPVQAGIKYANFPGNIVANVPMTVGMASITVPSLEVMKESDAPGNNPNPTGNTVGNLQNTPGATIISGPNIIKTPVPNNPTNIGAPGIRNPDNLRTQTVKEPTSPFWFDPRTQNLNVLKASGIPNMNDPNVPTTLAMEYPNIPAIRNPYVPLISDPNFLINPTLFNAPSAENIFKTPVGNNLNASSKIFIGMKNPSMTDPAAALLPNDPSVHAEMPPGMPALPLGSYAPGTGGFVDMGRPYASREVGSCSTSLPAAINDFSFNLFHELTRDNKSTSLIISPLSVAVALAMMYHGAGGDTARQMEQVLHFQKYRLADSSVTNGFVEILANLDDSGVDYKLLLSDDMFLHKSYTIAHRYTADLMAFYGASVRNLDFENDRQSAVNEVNSWVTDRTQNRIPKLFSEPFSPATRMLVLSVVYFRGLWKHPFPKDKTKDEDFRKPDGKPKKVSMMVLSHHRFRYLEDDDTSYQFLDIPYKGEDLSMLIALPGSVDSPADLPMTSDLLCRINSSMRYTTLEEVIFPKFRIEFQVQLKTPLRSLGVMDLFDEVKANLTGISRDGGLFVNSLLHKAVLDINEEGDKSVTKAMKGHQKKVDSHRDGRRQLLPSFVANHPFLMMIVDQRDGLILFSGKVTDPSY